MSGCSGQAAWIVTDFRCTVLLQQVQHPQHRVTSNATYWFEFTWDSTVPIMYNTQHVSGFAECNVPSELETLAEAVGEHKGVVCKMCTTPLCSPLDYTVQQCGILATNTLPEYRHTQKLCNESDSQPASVYAKCTPQRLGSSDHPPSTTSQPNAVPGAPMFASAGSCLPDQKICQELTILLIHPRSKQAAHPPPLSNMFSPLSTRVLTTTTSCHKMSDQSKAYHPSGMQ